MCSIKQKLEIFNLVLSLKRFVCRAYMKSIETLGEEPALPGERGEGEVAIVQV